MSGLRAGLLVVILDPGSYYGKMAEYHGDTGNGIVVQCPVGERDSLITACKYRIAAPEVQPR